MLSEHFNRLEELFHTALDQGPEFLAAACAGNEALRLEVEELLASYRAWSQELPVFSEPGPPRFGPYECDEVLGTGGMGTVYRAHRADDQFSQEVAIKVLRGSLRTDQYRQIFLSERQILAQLNHPHIARLLDGGMTQDGEPYLAMELVEGESIDAYCDRHRLPAERRLRLFLQVVEAVDYAHSHLVVHRDLKPSNILVTAEGQVKLLDFGTSKLVQEEATATLYRALTPRYASPEQLRGDSVTTASDVYSLGVMLYELLSGGPLFEDTSWMAMMARARGSESAPRLTARLTQKAAELRGRSVLQLRNELVGDLSGIVEKAISVELSRRYPTPSALGKDIELYLAGRPVSARSQTLAYRTRKFLRRRWQASAAVAVFVLGLIGAGIFSQYQLRVARTEATKAQAINRFLQEMIESSHPLNNSRNELTLREAVNEAAARLDRSKSLGALPEAELRLSLGISYLGQLDYAKMKLQLDRAETLFQAAGSKEGLLKTGSWRATANLQSGKRKEARQGYQRTLDTCRALGDPVPDLCLESRAALISEFSADRLDEAKTMLAEADGLLRKHPDLDPNEIASFLMTKGRVLTRQGRVDEAVASYEEAVRQARNAPQRDASAVAIPLMELSYLRANVGDFAKAADLARQYRDEFAQSSGPDSAYTLSAQGDLAKYLTFQGKLDEARTLADNACAKSEGGVPYQRLKQVEAAAIVRNEQGDGKGSYPFAIKSLETNAAVYPKTAASYGESLAELGISLVLQSRVAEGLVKLEEGEKIAANGLGTGHPFVTRFRRYIAMAKSKQISTQH